MVSNGSAIQTIKDILPGHTIIIKEPWVRILDDLTIDFYEKEAVILIPDNEDGD